MLIALIAAVIVLLVLRLSPQAATGDALTGAERELQTAGGMARRLVFRARVAGDPPGMASRKGVRAGSEPSPAARLKKLLDSTPA